MAGATRGRVVVRTRAFERVFAALAADALGVAIRTVSLRVADEQGRLQVAIVAPAAATESRTVLQLAALTRARIAGEGAEITGAALGTVTVRISGIEVGPIRRVR